MACGSKFNFFEVKNSSYENRKNPKTVGQNFILKYFSDFWFNTSKRTATILHQNKIL